MPKPSTATPPTVRWRAPRSDGLAHAYPKGELLTAACGAGNQPARFDWSRGSRCPDCLVALGQAI